MSRVRIKEIEGLEEAVVYSSSLDDSQTIPNSVGGFSSGVTVSQLNGKSFSEMFDVLLFPVVNPTFVNPSLGASNNASALHEINETISLTLTATFDRGGIYQPWTGNSLQNPRAGASTLYGFSGTSITSISQVGNIYTISSVVYNGNNTFNLYVSHSQGSQPLDSYGDNYDNPYPLGVLSNSTSFEGVYPVFATTVGLTTATKQTLYSMLSGNNIQIALVAESGADKQAFWLPTSWINSRPLTSIQYYNTVSGQFDSTNKISDFTTSSVNFTVQSLTVNYMRYIYNGLTRGATLIKLIF